MVRGGLGFSAYQPVLFFMKGEAKIRNQIKDVREISTSSQKCAERDHPYQKDGLFVADVITCCTSENDAVLDPFLGSGTTMIACENLGRKCRGAEVDPGYVAVCLERYKTTFNKMPVLLEGD